MKRYFTIIVAISLVLIFNKSAFCNQNYQSSTDSLVTESQTESKKVEIVGGDRIAILAGGSCNELQNNDNFIQPVTNWTKFLLRAGWKVTVFFGDSNQQSRLEKFKFPFNKVKIYNFNWNDFLQGLKDIPAEEGKQLLVGFFAHGEKINHGICAEDQIYHPVSDLSPILNEFHSKDVQIGLYDASCYGANSIDILDSDNYCVVALAGRNHQGTNVLSTAASELLINNGVSDIDSDDMLSMEEYLLSAKLINKRNNISLMYSSISGDHPALQYYDRTLNSSSFTSNNPYSVDILENYESNRTNINNLLEKIGYTEAEIQKAIDFYKSGRSTPYMPEEAVVSAINYLIANYANNDFSFNICSQFYLD